MANRSVVKIESFSNEVTKTLRGPPFPGGIISLTNSLTWTIGGGRFSTYLATHGGPTASDDTPANRNVRGVFSGNIDFSITLFDGTDPAVSNFERVGLLNKIRSEGRTRSSNIGSLTFLDPTGEILDYLINHTVDGSTVTISSGPKTANISTYAVDAKLVSAGIAFDGVKKVLKLRDFGWLLEKAPLHDNHYTGDGGLSGEANLKDVIKPILYGWRNKITPRLIDSINHVYQISCCKIDAVESVEDGGIKLGTGADGLPDADYATYALMLAATPAAGHYVTCLNEGTFKTGGSASKRITCTARGDSESVDSIGYINTRAGIARRIATWRGPLHYSASDLDTASFTALDVAQPGEIGFFFDTEITKAAALDIVMDGCIGEWYVDITGMMFVDYLREPPTSAPDYTLTMAGEIGGDGKVDGTISSSGNGAKRQKTIGIYQENTSIMKKEELGSLTDTEALIWSLDGLPSDCDRDDGFPVFSECSP